MARPSLALAVVVALLLLLYQRAAAAVPFYFMWDMDWTTALDCLVIQGGGLPDHVNHTSFGMYLVLAWTHRLAHAAGRVSFLDLTDAAAAGNPLAGAAELTDLLRAHSPLVLVGVVLAQAAALRGASRLVGRDPLRAWPLLALVVLLLGVHEAALYQAMLVRSELYSLLFWSLALAAGVAGLRARSARTSALRLGLCGGLLALAWMTKLQALVLVAWLVALLALLATVGRARTPLLRLERAGGQPLARGLALLAPVTLLAAAARGAHVPPGAAAFVARYQPNSALLLLLGAFAAPLALALARRRLAALEALLVGAVGAGLLHFALHADPRTGWAHLLVDAKMLLYRTNYQTLEHTGPWLVVDRLEAAAAGAPGAFVVHAGLLALALRAVRGWRARALVLAAEALLLAHVGLATRDVLRDGLWVLPPLAVGSVVLALLALSRLRAPLQAAGVAALLALALLSQARQAATLPARLHAHYVDYGWRIAPWLGGVYDGAHQSYSALVAAKADPAAPARWAGAAAAQAHRWAETRRDARHVLVNQPHDLRDVTVAEAGFLLPHDPAARLAVVPEGLRGATVVRPRAWTPTARRFDPESLRRMRLYPEWHAQVVTDPPAVPRLALLGRPDLDVVLFLPAGAPDPAGLVGGPERVEVATPAGPVTLRAFRLDDLDLGYGEVEAPLLEGDAFVVIKRRF